MPAANSSDGQTSSAVYEYVRARDRRKGRVFAVKGASDAEGKVEIWRPEKTNSVDPNLSGRKSAKYGVRPQIIGTAKAKDSILGWAQEGGRVRLTGNGPYRMHWYETVRPDFYEQLLSEIKIPVRNNPKRRQWKKRTDRHNEVLDCTVYTCTPCGWRMPCDCTSKSRPGGITRKNAFVSEACLTRAIHPKRASRPYPRRFQTPLAHW